MNRYVFAAVLSFSFVCAVFAGTSNKTSGSAWAAVRATPTPVAIAYDEITRMAFAQVTPAPVGAFAADYQRIMSSAQQQSQNSSMPPQAQAMLKRMGISGIAANPMAAMQNGTLKRYTFYWVKGWIRVDDPLDQTAIIYKCREHQTIYLDLAKKTYHIVNGNTDTTTSGAPAGTASNPYARAMMAPGTVTMAVIAKATALGAKVVEGIPTHGYDSSNALTMTNATGSCKNGSFSSRVVEYISNINEQRAYCPLPGRASGDAARYGGPVGGCKPSVVAHQAGTVHPPPGKLAMYRMSQFNAGGGQGGAMVLERGHVNWFYNRDIPAIFNVPADFTQQPS